MELTIGLFKLID